MRLKIHYTTPKDYKYKAVENMVIHIMRESAVDNSPNEAKLEAPNAHTIHRQKEGLPLRLV